MSDTIKASQHVCSVPTHCQKDVYHLATNLTCVAKMRPVLRASALSACAHEHVHEILCEFTTLVPEEIYADADIESYLPVLPGLCVVIVVAIRLSRCLLMILCFFSYDFVIFSHDFE